jgi:hypothetical protein
VPASTAAPTDGLGATFEAVLARAFGQLGQQSAQEGLAQGHGRRLGHGACSRSASSAGPLGVRERRCKARVLTAEPR